MITMLDYIKSILCNDNDIDKALYIFGLCHEFGHIYDHYYKVFTKNNQTELYSNTIASLIVNMGRTNRERQTLYRYSPKEAFADAFAMCTIEKVLNNNGIKIHNNNKIEWSICDKPSTFIDNVDTRYNYRPHGGFNENHYKIFVNLFNKTLIMADSVMSKIFINISTDNFFDDYKALKDSKYIKMACDVQNIYYNTIPSKYRELFSNRNIMACYLVPYIIIGFKDELAKMKEE